MTLGKPFHLPPPALLTAPRSPSSYLSPSFLASGERSVSRLSLASWGASGEEVESSLVPPFISATERVTSVNVMMPAVVSQVPNVGSVWFSSPDSPPSHATQSEAAPSLNGGQLYHR